MREKDRAEINNLAPNIFSGHLETGLIDAYNGQTREAIMRRWEAGLVFLEDSLSGKSSFEREAIAAHTINCRGWTGACGGITY